MPCYRPLAARQARPGAPLSFDKGYRCGDRVLFVPCGQCIGCRLDFSERWAVRCMHEAQLHDHKCMLTLTYDDAHLPADLSLQKEPFQLFMKRLRRRLGYKVRYYMCGEYGEKYSRPHYHCILFGFSPTDKQYWKTSDAGFKCYTSKWLDSVWQVGAVYVGDVSFESAAYVARYVVKKVGSDGPKREIFNVDTGEVTLRKHEYGKMSLKPGIGADWFQRYATDVYPHDRCMVGAVPHKVPSYYDVLLDRMSPLYLADVKAKRLAKADEAYARLELEHWEDRFTDLKRLRVCELVRKASIKLLKRE